MTKITDNRAYMYIKHRNKTQLNIEQKSQPISTKSREKK